MPAVRARTPNPNGAAGQRLLLRARSGLGARFVDYLVVDEEFATVPFLHAADLAGVPVVARLKDNLPELLAAVENRFGSRPPTRVCRSDAAAGYGAHSDQEIIIEEELYRFVRFQYEAVGEVI